MTCRAGIIYPHAPAATARTRGSALVGWETQVEISLLVIELEIAVVEKGDLEPKRPIPRRGLQEIEVRFPAVEVPAEADRVVVERAALQVVGGPPAQIPILSRAHRHRSGQHLADRRAAAAGTL